MNRANTAANRNATMNRSRSLLVALALTLSAAPVEAGLLAYFPFDADFTDASGNANHLSIAEGVPTITPTEGNFIFGGGALDLESTVSDRAFLELTNPLSFGATDPWSVAFWARRRAGSDDRQGMVVGDTANTTDFIWLSNNPTQVQGMRFRSSDNANSNYDVGPDDGAWHHWAIVADGAGNLAAYRDNVPLGSMAGSTVFSLKNVAQAYNTNVHSFNGQIDELYLYDEAIDAGTVEALFLGSGVIDFTITTLEYSPDDGLVTLTWNSREGETYAVRASRDLSAWNIEFDDSVEADAGDLTTKTFDLGILGPEAPGELFFRVEKP